MVTGSVTDMFFACRDTCVMHITRRVWGVCAEMVGRETPGKLFSPVCESMRSLLRLPTPQCVSRSMHLSSVERRLLTGVSGWDFICEHDFLVVLLLLASPLCD